MRRYSIMQKKVLGICAVVFFLAICSMFMLSVQQVTAAEKLITIGIFNDMTGPTSSMSAQGFAGRDYWLYVNQKGGMNGWKFNPIMLDTKENIPEETKAFKRFATQDNAVWILGWSTGGTKALRDQVNSTGLSFLSHSLTQTAVDPVKYPFNFIFGPTYEDQIKAAMDLMAEKGGKTVAFLRSELEWGKITYQNIVDSGYAEKAGLKIVGAIPIPPKPTDVSTQMLQLKSMNPDFVYVIGVPNDSIPILKDGFKIGIPSNKIIGINWNTHVSVPKTAGAAAEGFMANQPNFPWGADNAVMDEINEFMKTNTVTTKEEFYSRAWFTARVVGEGIRRVLEKDPKAPEDIKAFRKKVRDSVESLKYNPGRNLPEIDYSNHQGFTTMKIVQVKDGAFKEITGYVKPKHK